MNFYLPDFYYNFNLNMQIVQLLQEYPEYFYDGVQIGAIYGTFPGAIWNGGRKFLTTTDLDNIINTIDAFNQKNISLRFTFTNCLLEEKHLFDTYCNLIAEIGNNNQNGIIINSELLENYLRQEYPNYQYILSTTRCERDIDKINLYTDIYDMVVTDYRDNSNFDFLSQIQNKNKIELLINAYCSPDCKRRQEHYKSLSKNQLRYSSTEDEEFMNCPTYNRDFYDTLYFDSVIKDLSLYSNLGFNNFKIEGRTVNPFNIIESYLYYMVKPEYRDKVRLILLKAIN